MASKAGLPWDAPAPTEHGKHWVKIELDHPVNPWEHEGAGSIGWGAQLDRLAPLGEEAVSIIKEAWRQRRVDPRERAKRVERESEPVDRRLTTSPSIGRDRLGHSVFCGGLCLSVATGPILPKIA